MAVYRGKKIKEVFGFSVDIESLRLKYVEEGRSDVCHLAEGEPLIYNEGAGTLSFVMKDEQDLCEYIITRTDAGYQFKQTDRSGRTEYDPEDIQLIEEDSRVRFWFADSYTEYDFILEKV